MITVLLSGGSRDGEVLDVPSADSWLYLERFDSVEVDAYERNPYMALGDCPLYVWRDVT